MLQAEPFIKIYPFPNVKEMIDCKTRLVKLSYNTHTDFHIFPVICRCIPGVFIVPCNLIAGIRVHVQHFFRNPQRGYGIINLFFLPAVD